MSRPPGSRLRQLGLLRAVVRRSRSDWPLVLAAWLLLACSTSLITAAVTYSESVTLGGFRRTIEASAPATNAVRVHANLPGGSLAAADAAVKPAIRETLGSVAGQTDLITATNSLSLAGVDASDESRQIRVGSYGEIAAHSTLTSGRWAAAGATPVEATLSVGAASALGLATGDRTTLTSKLDPTRRTEVVIVGLWQPNPGDRYWLGSGLDLTGVQSVGTSTTRGPFVVAEDDLIALAGSTSVDVEWRWLPAIDSLQPAQADGLRSAIATLADRAQGAYPDTYVWAESGLPDTLEAASTALLVARSSILLLFAQFAVVAVYAILLVAGMLVERRRPESALLRSRGAGSGHAALLAMGEATLLAVPAVVVAPFFAQAMVGLMSSVGPLATARVLAPVGIDGTAIAAAVGAGLGCVIVLTLPALPAGGTLAGVRAALGRQVGRTLAQRLGLDLVLAAVAVVAIWQLRLYGAPLTRTVRGDLGIDPLLAAAPAICLLAGALVATRLVPRLGEIGERLLEGGRGLTAPLLARQLGRRPLRYTRLALLLMLAASLGSFAAMFAATWSRSQSDQAAYEAAADVRVTLADRPTLPYWALGPAYGAVPGVESTSAVARTTFEVGRDVAGGQLLAVDPATVGALASLPAGALGDSPAATIKALADAPMAPMLALPGQPERLAVTLDTDLMMQIPDEFPIDPSLPATEVQVSVVLSDAGGLHRFDARSVATCLSPGARAIAELSATVGGIRYLPAWPLHLEAIEIRVTGPYSSFLSGSLRLRGVEVSGSSAGTDWQTVDLPFASAGWGWSKVSRQDVTPYQPPSGSPGTVSIGYEEGDAQADEGTTFRYWAMPGGPSAIPALANQALLDATGARQGDTILASRFGFESPVKIVATAATFPTLDPAKPFLVVDRSALDLIDYASWGLIDTPSEMWLTVAPGSETGVVTTLGGGPYSAASVVGRAQLEEARRVNPIALGVIGALLLGSLAAVALTVIGFLVTVAFMARERSGELALLRALGQSTRGVVTMLSVEETALLAYGLVAGIGLGLLIGWLAIPFASLTSSGAAPVPAPTLVVPWPTIAAVSLPVVVALALGAVVLIRVAAARPVAEALRGREVEP
jgi:hypothetical protein